MEEELGFLFRRREGSKYFVDLVVPLLLMVGACPCSGELNLCGQVQIFNTSRLVEEDRLQLEVNYTAAD